MSKSTQLMGLPLKNPILVPQVPGPGTAPPSNAVSTPGQRL